MSCVPQYLWRKSVKWVLYVFGFITGWFLSASLTLMGYNSSWENKKVYWSKTEPFELFLLLRAQTFTSLSAKDVRPPPVRVSERQRVDERAGGNERGVEELDETEFPKVKHRSQYVLLDYIGCIIGSRGEMGWSGDICLLEIHLLSCIHWVSQLLSCCIQMWLV